MRLREIFRRDNTAPGAGLLMAVVWLAQEGAAQGTLWDKIPFGWFAIAAFAFWMGQDLYHPNGRLRHAIRRLRSVGEFGPATCKIEFSILAMTTADNKNLVGFMCHLHFQNLSNFGQ